jgi:hypothetical protein
MASDDEDRERRVLALCPGLSPELLAVAVAWVREREERPPLRSLVYESFPPLKPKRRRDGR